MPLYSVQGKRTFAPPAKPEMRAPLQSQLRQRETELAEKDGIIRALVASAKGPPDYPRQASYNTLETTRQRLESTRRRILESPSSSSAGIGGRFTRFFSPKSAHHLPHHHHHHRDFSSASLDRHHATRIYPRDRQSRPIPTIRFSFFFLYLRRYGYTLQSNARTCAYRV